MNTREAYAALAAGKKVRCTGARVKGCVYMDESGALNDSSGNTCKYLEPGESFDLVEEPATDEELIAEMERKARESRNINERATYEHCAEMLKTRKVKP
jgi:hypothetical protein